MPQNTEDVAMAIMSIIIILLSIAVHEWAHAITADLLGDDTPRLQGRVTLWPPAHWDILGTIGIIVTSFLGFGLGWGKPVQCNPTKFNRKVTMRDGMSMVAVAGPLANLTIALLFGLTLRFGLWNFDPFAHLFARLTVILNLAQFCFNLIPIPPLDGSKIFVNALPDKTAESFEKFFQTVGPMLFLILIVSKLPSLILYPLVMNLYSFIVGS